MNTYKLSSYGPFYCVGNLQAVRLLATDSFVKILHLIRLSTMSGVSVTNVDNKRQTFII